MYQIKLRICQNIYYFHNFMLPNDCFSFRITRTADYFLFCKILGWSILIQSFAKFIMGDIVADTAVLSNASKKESLWSCYKHTSRACLQLNGMAAEKRGLCLSGKSKHATILERQSWALDCFCDCDVFSTIN